MERSTTVAEPAALTDVSQTNYFEADFSPGAGFYLLSYRGPNVPWQSVFQIGKNGA